MDTKKLRQKILDLAIRGKLVPQDPNDEPASVLLERIRAEKERLIKEGKIKQSKKSAKSSDTPHYENEVPFEVPKGWVYCQVSDIFELNPKNDIPDDTQSGFIPMACVDDGFGYSHTFETRVWKEIKKGYSHFQNGDIGIAKISPCFENRKSTIFYDLPNGIGAGTTELTVLRGHCVNTEFYLYLFQSEWYIFEGTKEFKGVVGQQRVNKEIFTTLLIPLPPIEEQNRVVTEIKKWFTLIDTLESAKEDLQTSIAQAKSKILDLAIHGKLAPQDPNDEPAIELLKRINPKFVPCDNAHYPFSIPETWQWSSLENISTDSADGPFGSNLKKEHYTSKKEVRIIQLSNIGEEGWRDENTKYTTFEHLKEISRSEVNPNDIVIAKMMPAGRAILCPNFDQKYVLSSDAVKFHINNEIYYKYILYAINSEVFRDQVYDNVQGVTRIRTSLQKLRKYVIPLPPYKEQQHIVAKIEELFAVLDEIQKSIEA